MNLGDAKDSYTRRKEIPFSSEQKWMAVRCSPKNEVSLAVVKTSLAVVPRLAWKAAASARRAGMAAHSSLPYQNKAPMPGGRG